ncbi:hypothetical protein [Mycobacterium lepromatosis]|uniref:hypothetical protein n=1 Tax=Mycobacterium lepromatosis TaxID=480418 RepID=UPI000A74DAA1|nr:hypothetical protein [Mycobacterium lepromatosis]
MVEAYIEPVQLGAPRAAQHRAIERSCHHDLDVLGILRRLTDSMRRVRIARHHAGEWFQRITFGTVELLSNTGVDAVI